MQREKRTNQRNHQQSHRAANRCAQRRPQRNTDGPNSRDFNVSIVANDQRDVFVSWTSTTPSTSKSRPRRHSSSATRWVWNWRTASGQLPTNGPNCRRTSFSVPPRKINNRTQVPDGQKTPQVPPQHDFALGYLSFFQPQVPILGGGRILVAHECRHFGRTPRPVGGDRPREENDL